MAVIDRRRIARVIHERLHSQLGADVKVLAAFEPVPARMTEALWVQVTGLSLTDVARDPSGASALYRMTVTLTCTASLAAGAADVWAVEKLASRVIAALRRYTIADVATTGHVIEFEDVEASTVGSLDEDRTTASAGVTFGGLVQRASGTTFEGP